MAGSEEAYAEVFFDEIPDKREFEERVAVCAGVWGLAFGVNLSEVFDYKLLKGFGYVDEIMWYTKVSRYDGGFCSAAASDAGVAGDGDFHRDAEDFPASLLEERSGNAAIDAAAHQDGYLP